MTCDVAGGDGDNSAAKTWPCERPAASASSKSVTPPPPHHFDCRCMNECMRHIYAQIIIICNRSTQRLQEKQDTKKKRGNRFDAVRRFAVANACSVHVEEQPSHFVCGAVRRFSKCHTFFFHDIVSFPKIPIKYY